MINSTFKFPVTVAGKTYPKAEKPWQIGQPLPEPKEGTVYLVNAINFNTYKDVRNDICMLNPHTRGESQEYNSFIFSTFKEYTLVLFPESQNYMEECWFQEEAQLADFDKFGGAAYFIPTKLL